jgi:hypothetical protein
VMMASSLVNQLVAMLAALHMLQHQQSTGFSSKT